MVITVGVVQVGGKVKSVESDDDVRSSCRNSKPPTNRLGSGPSGRSTCSCASTPADHFSESTLEVEPRNVILVSSSRGR